MLAAVCETAENMEPKGTPWRIGKHFGAGAPGKSYGKWGTFGVASGFDKAGSGYLTYNPKHKTWSTWYGASVGGHGGHASHTFKADAAAYGDTLPPTGVEQREEFSLSPTNGVSTLSTGTGDHQSDGVWRYHPLLGDIGLMKTIHGYSFFQQLGLDDISDGLQKKSVEGKTNRVGLGHWGDYSGAGMGGLRPCGDGWIAAYITKDGDGSAICAKISADGDITTKATIATGFGTKPLINENREWRTARIAPLGSKESEAKCGPSARFLYGYMQMGGGRFLVEVDGDCTKLTAPQDVSTVTSWSHMQDWDTTREGAVVWVNTWERSTDDGSMIRDDEGLSQYPEKMDGLQGGLPVKMHYSHPSLAFTPVYTYTDRATNEAQLSSYWP